MFQRLEMFDFSPSITGVEFKMLKDCLHQYINYHLLFAYYY